MKLLSAESFPVYLAGFLWVVFITVTKLWPASWWFDVHSVYIHDTTEGEAVVMTVDREIKRDFVGTWVSTVRRVEDGRFEVVCASHGDANYREGSALPKTLTLSWWTDGACTTLPAGRYYVSTDWRIRDEPFWPIKRVSADSNIFEVRR